tara:strand:- start:2838 stop:3233 length:396 start_codon:yes stop_codon:yes gene_type:complete
MAGKYSKKRVLGFVGQDAISAHTAVTASYGELFATAEIADDIFEISLTVAADTNADLSLATPKKPSDLGTYDVEVGRIFKVRLKTLGSNGDLDIAYSNASGNSSALTLDAAGEEVTFIACEEGYLVLAKNF